MKEQLLNLLENVEDETLLKRLLAYLRAYLEE